MENREDNGAGGVRPPDLPAVDEVQRVDAEPMGGAGPAASGEAEYRFGTYAANGPMGGGARIHVFQARAGMNGELLKPPVFAAWACLIVAWFFLGSKVPFTVFLGIPFDLAALLLAVVCLTRGGVLTGLLVMGLGTAGSVIVYLVGLFRFLSM